MYGEASTPTQSYEEAHANEVDSTIKGVLDNWYENNILDNYHSYISDTLFCNDRSRSSGTGYGSTDTDYGSDYRLYANKVPTLKCPQPNDAFTVSDTNHGNGALTYPISLLTADEASLAGLLYYTNNTSNYLHTGHIYWLLSPWFLSGSAYPWIVSSNGNLRNDNYATDSRGARGVLNLNSNTEIISGTGSISDPYKVI